MQLSHIRLGLVLVGLLATSAWAEDVNLLKNGQFAAADTAGNPKLWKIRTKDCKVSIDKDQKPEGVEQSLKVEIQKQADGLGEIVQGIKEIKTGARYRLEGSIKSSKAGVGVFQIKLRNGSKEGKRVMTEYSSTEWKTFSSEFVAEGADNIQVLCRFKQGEEQVNQTVWFANVKLTLLAADEAK